MLFEMGEGASVKIGGSFLGLLSLNGFLRIIIGSLAIVSIYDFGNCLLERMRSSRFGFAS